MLQLVVCVCVFFPRFCWAFSSSWLPCSSSLPCSFQSKSWFLREAYYHHILSKYTTFHVQHLGRILLFLFFLSVGFCSLHCASDICALLSSLSLDKALHSAGISTGFIIFGTNLTNPLNELLLVLQPVSIFSSFMMKRWLSLIKIRLKSFCLCPFWSTFFFSWLPLNALMLPS